MRLNDNRVVIGAIIFHAEDEDGNKRVKSARDRACVMCFSLFTVYNNYKIIARRNERPGRASSPRRAAAGFIYLHFWISVATLWAASVHEENGAAIPRRIHRPYRDLYLTPGTPCATRIITIPVVNTGSTNNAEEWTECDVLIFFSHYSKLTFNNSRDKFARLRHFYTRNGKSVESLNRRRRAARSRGLNNREPRSDLRPLFCLLATACYRRALGWDR